VPCHSEHSEESAVLFVKAQLQIRRFVRDDKSH
jgi:hypothetical protein